MKKNLVIVSVLALALILSPLSGIGAGVFAGEGNTPVALASVSGSVSGSTSGSDVTPTATPNPTAAPTDPTAAPTDPTAAPTQPTATPSVSGGDVTPTATPTAAPTEPTATPAPTEDVVENLNKVLDDNSDASPDEVVAALKNTASVEEIGTAMAADEALCNKVASLENSYAEEKNITVNAPAVSESAKEYVDSSKVTVVGAAFNAEPGATVELRMDEAAAEDVRSEAEVNKELAEFNRTCVNRVVLDLSLHVNDAAKSGEMSMPVTITMPVPAGLSVDGLLIRHCHDNGESEWVALYWSDNKTMITFSVSSFSTFEFIQTAAVNVPSNPSKGSGSDANRQDNLENLISAAAPGTIIKITKDQNINSLSNSVMKQLAKRGDVALEMEYTYEGVDYHIVIPAGLAESNDIPWYGPLYLAAHYSSYAVNAGFVNTASSVYVVQRGDTLSRIARKNNTTVAKLAAVNPQIKNVNRIMPGQIITIQ